MHADELLHLDTRIAKLVATEFNLMGPGNGVAVVHEGHVLHCQGYGLANIEWGVPVTLHTLFRIGSLTKQFTTVCILMLVDQGLFDVDAPITTYLPDYPNAHHKISVRHLLNHTAGIGNHSASPTAAHDFRQDISLEALVERIAHIPVEFEPGARMHTPTPATFSWARSSSESQESGIKSSLPRESSNLSVCLTPVTRLIFRFALGAPPATFPGVRINS